jgi:hypothetical protein
MFKETIVDQIEITQNGTIQVRLHKQLNDKGAITKLGLHRTAFSPSADVGSVDRQMVDVNTHLLSMGEGKVSMADTDKIKAIATVVWTPEVVAAYKAMQEQVE